MTNSLLRSGCPDDFLSLGENGQAVFDSAWQIRETLRLRKQQAVADALAIPQINDRGDRIDWYAPHSGLVTSWAAATDEQRTAAVHTLERCMATIHLLSSQCLGSGKTAQRLFGSLLAKALQFPGSQYIYLVGDKPVVTFWGFVNQNETAREDILACLQVRGSDEPFIEPPLHSVQSVQAEETPCEADTAAPLRDIAAAYALEANPIPETDDVSDIKIVTTSRNRWLPIGTFLVIFMALLSGGYVLVHQQKEDEVTAFAENVEQITRKPTVINVPMTTLPLMEASVIPPVAVKVDEPEAVVSQEPPPKGALVMPAEELKNGSTKFLNGSWRVRAQFSDPIAGKPPTLRYRIINNKGTVRLFNSDNVSCKAEVFSGLHQSGILMIKSRGNARCNDGTRHVLPEISCKAGINGVAECTGRYPGDSLVPVTFQKVSN